MTTRPGDSQSLYVTAQNGAVHRVDENGNSALWFDYNASVNAAITNASNGYVLDSPTNAHGGLRSVAFHPEFATNGKFYTSAMVDRPSNAAGFHYLGNSSSGFDAESAVVEWTYNHGAGQVDANSYRELFRVRMPRFDHPVKQMAFNPYAQQGDEDYGLLYIAHGDGSFQSAIAGGGLNPGDALGKVLRIDPLQNGGNAYSTPSSPFQSDPSTLNEIYTLGHRNPHHISFAKDANGNSYAIVAEAGRDNIEEVNLLQAGGNYGWSDREGTFVHLEDGGYINGVTGLPANEWQLNDYIYPAAQYDHDANPGNGFVGSAIAGGFVISNGSDEDLQGQYIFADFGFKSGYVYHADFEEMLGAHTQLADGELPSELTQAVISRLTLTLDSDGDGDVDVTADNLNSLLGVSRNDVRFGMGPNGEMYISSKQNGLVYLVTNTVSVPEPCSLLLMGALGLGLMSRRRR
ncbi:MAG: PQQ-dependent sugar dehydrogenase [Phycisphaeraceae bacterium]|nr:PQQ-dependent sugar dehydrogenase [Phycisphaeraceae bacterium]